MTLEEYFRGCYNGGDWQEGNAIDHALRHEINAKGEVQFVLHPQDVNGETMDFVVEDNTLRPLAFGEHHG